MAITISGSGITSANIADGTLTSSDFASGAVEGVPSGCILMWSGSAAAIPTGWNLCDGTNSTPNLIGKFIKSASTAGGTGGSNTHSHSHTLSAGSHTLSIAEMPSHNHSLTIRAGSSLCSAWPSPANSWQCGGSGYTSSTGGGGSHSHSLAGSITSGSNEPAYFELCYIMKA
jgi:hypothetical protein